MLRLAFLFALTAPLALAQQGEAFVQQAEQALGSSALALTGTAGTGSVEAEEALSVALLSAASDDANVAAVVQEGRSNDVELDQSGTGNRFGLVVDGSRNAFALSQIGGDNQFLGDVIGDDNLLSGTQSGGGNSYELFLDGVSGTDHALTQTGGGNSAVQIVGAGMAPASIEQSGGATVVIERR